MMFDETILLKVSEYNTNVSVVMSIFFVCCCCFDTQRNETYRLKSIPITQSNNITKKCDYISIKLVLTFGNSRFTIHVYSLLKTSFYKKYLCFVFIVITLYNFILYHLKYTNRRILMKLAWLKSV